MKRMLTYICLMLICPILLSGQDFSVKDFFLAENDLTANTPGSIVTDQNGYVCALIKVETTLDDYSFDVGSLGITKTLRQGGEIWVYVPYGVRRITISHPKMGVIRDFVFPFNIESGRTYIMKLNASLGNRVYDSSRKQRMILEVSPSNAKVEINGISIPVSSNGVYDQEFSFGLYDLIVSDPKYHTARKQVEINDPAVPHRVKISLKPTFGWLKINGSGDEKLYIDSEYRNFTPNSKIELSSSTYRILLEKPQHRAFATTVQITDSSTVAIDPEFEPIIARFTVNSNPANADVYIDDKYAGKTPYTAETIIGTYRISLKKDGYAISNHILAVNEGADNYVYAEMDRSVAPRITSYPAATLSVDGKVIGRTPARPNMSIGDHKVTLVADGYVDCNKTVRFDDSDKDYSFDLKKKLYYGKFGEIGLIAATNFKYTDLGATLGLYNGRKLYAGLDLMFGLTKTEEYRFITENITCAFIPVTFLFKAGCPFNAGARMQICPVAGVGAYSLLDDIFDENLSYKFDTYVKDERSAAALQLMGGIRFNFAITESVEINITPAFYYRTNGTEFLQSLTALSPYADGYGKGFKLHIGVNLYTCE